MARYKVLTKSFINNHIHGPDEAPEFREVEKHLLELLYKKQ